jgi:hypothetical protein
MVGEEARDVVHFVADDDPAAQLIAVLCNLNTRVLRERERKREINKECERQRGTPTSMEEKGVRLQREKSGGNKRYHWTLASDKERRKERTQRAYISKVVVLPPVTWSPHSFFVSLKIE